MSASKSLTKGPLPPEIYWRRRIVLLVGAAVLVFAIAHLLGGGSDGKSGGGPSAQQAGAPITDTSGSSADETDSAPMPGRSTGAVQGPTAPLTASTGASTPTAPLTLAAPSGTCNSGDIAVTPKVEKAVAGSDVTVQFALQTKRSPACTWQMNKRQLAVKIVRHGKILWTSQQCPDALPQRSVVVRNVVPSIVTMKWNSRVSTVGCHPLSDFVRQGKLTIWASTLGGEPAHSDFDLVLASAQTVPVSPKGDPTSGQSGSATDQPRR